MQAWKAEHDYGIARFLPQSHAAFRRVCFKELLILKVCEQRKQSMTAAPALAPSPAYAFPHRTTPVFATNRARPYTLIPT